MKGDKTNRFSEHVDMVHRTRKRVEIVLRPQSRTIEGVLKAPKGAVSV